MHIPDWPVAGDREIGLLREVLASRHWGGFHPFVADFEQRFAQFQHCQHGIAVMNGTVSLEAAFAVEELGPGDEVIVPAISFVSTATAISRAGATPVFVDIEPYSFNLCPRRVEEAIGPRTKGIVAVHFGGPLANMDALTDIAQRRGIHLYEDAAHAHGAEWRGKRAGSFGRWGSFSFQNGKVLTAGEGGALVTNDSDLAARFRNFVNLGRSMGGGADGTSFYHHYTLGTNFRMTALQAAVLTAQLERLPAQVAHRERAEKLLRELTANVPWLTWQQVPAEVNVHPHYLLPGRIAGQSRDKFCQHLKEQGVPCTPFYPHPLYGNPLYQEGGCRIMPCPNAEACVQDAFWLPHRLLLADDETIHETASIIRAAA